MNNFFLASSLIFVISILIFTYYWIKQLIRSKREKKLKGILNKKYHSDGKEYLRNFISHYIPLLIENKIQWILIWSKLNSKYKVELSYNSINAKMQISTTNLIALDQHKNGLIALGINDFETNHNASVFKIVPNAKIITDVIYYIFINIYELKNFSNYKIVTS